MIAITMIVVTACGTRSFDADSAFCQAYPEPAVTPHEDDDPQTIEQAVDLELLRRRLCEEGEW